MPDELSAAALDAALRGRFGRPSKVLAEIDSTNLEALRWAATGAPEGAIVVADQQTAGRGRWGRTWFSVPGQAVMFSIVLRPELPARQMGLLTTALGVATAEAIEGLAALAVGIKWPNDIVVDGRKVAGILVETRVGGSLLEAVVAGIGINVHARAEELPDEIAQRATSIAAELERRDLASSVRRVELLAAILQAFERRYDELQTMPQRVVAAAAARSEVLGRDVSVRLAGGEMLEGRAVGLADSGALELDVGGTRRAIEAGEIERLRSG